jgi:hypothetical protein
MTSEIALLLLLFSSGGIERDGVSQSTMSGIVKDERVIESQT